jgi:hypothetical protein
MQRLVILLLCIVASLANLWKLRPLDDLDTFNQIVLGSWFPQHILLTSNEPSTQVFAGWLAQVLFATIHSFAGLPGIKTLNLLLLAGTFLILGLWHATLARTRSAIYPSPLAVGAGLVSAFLVSASNISARPQSFAYLGFCTLLFLLTRWSRKSTTISIQLASLCGILIVWQNCHPSIVLALPVLFVFTLLRRCSPVLILTVPIAFFCTPDGASLLSISTTNTEISKNLLAISEWMPPWHYSVYSAMAGFWTILGVTFALGILAYRRKIGIDPIPALLSLLFLIPTLYSARFAVFWGFVNAPLFGELVSALWAGSLGRSSTSTAHPRTLALGAAALVGCAVIFPGPLLPSSSPLAAFRAIKAEFPTATIFNYREFGGQLEYVGYPDWRVYIDGRLYLYSKELWDQYHAISSAKLPTGLATTLGAYDLLVLSPRAQASLISFLREQPIKGHFVVDSPEVVIFKTAK